jgi:Ca-activated chloride channel family protein
MNSDYYELLGINRDASLDLIKKAYHELAKKYHPDLNQEPDSSEQFLEIQAAFEVLQDPVKKKEYDAKFDQEKFAQPVTRLSVLTSRKAITRINEDQLVYAAMEIECLKMNEEIESGRVHICLVIDQSTSMQGNRMDMVKSNVNRVLSTLNSKDLLSIVTFSDDATVFLPPTRMANKSVIESRLSQITPGGGTEIRKGIKTGIDLLWEGHEDSFTRYLILLTDGHTYGDEENCYALANEAAEHGIVISAMGIGNEWNETFLEKLTALTGGITLFVNSKDALSQYLERIFSSIDYVYAKKLVLHIEKDQRVDLQFLIQLEPSIIQYSTKPMNILMGDLYFGKKSLFLMEFLVHPLIKKDKDVKLLKGQIKMELPNEKHKYARLFANIELPVVEENLNDKPPDEIVRALARLTMYYMQERSREDVKIGSYVRAARRLNYLATRLLEEGEVRLAGRVMSESDTIQKTHKFSQDGEKELKYGTKQLLALPKPK